MRAKEFIKEDAQPNVQSAEKIKSDIVTKVNDIYDIDELNQIYSFIRKVDIGSVEGFGGLFDKDPDLKQVKGILSHAIIDAKADFKDKLGFAKEMVNPGIIDLEKLLTPGLIQNLENLVSTNYPNVFSAVAPSLLNLAGSFQTGNKKTQVGKGEFFLAVAHPKIYLSKTGGDLMVGDRKIEVKADYAALKGRKGYGTTDQTYAVVRKNVAKFLASNIKQEAAHPDFVIEVAARSNFWSQFGPYCIKNGVDAAAVSNFMKEQLKMIVRALYLDLPNNIVNDLANTIDSKSGVIDFNSFYFKIKYVAFWYYQKQDNFSGIIFVNGDTLNIAYIETPEQFQQTIRTKKLGFQPGSQNGLQIRI